MSYGSEELQILGKAIEVIGVALTASKILHVPILESWRPFLAALWRGQDARDAIEISKLDEDDEVSVAQGTSLIMLGLLLQISLYIYDKVVNILMLARNICACAG